MHLVRLANALPKTKKVHETTTLLHVTLPIFISPTVIFFIGRLSNKPFLIWLLTTPPYLKYVATLRCNLSLTACSLVF